MLALRIIPKSNSFDTFATVAQSPLWVRSLIRPNNLDDLFQRAGLPWAHADYLRTTVHRNKSSGASQLSLLFSCFSQKAVFLAMRQSKTHRTCRKTLQERNPLSSHPSGPRIYNRLQSLLRVWTTVRWDMWEMLTGKNARTPSYLLCADYGVFGDEFPSEQWEEYYHASIGVSPSARNI